MPGILITGHARSGTGYMAKLFSANGFQIGHEEPAKDGISAWMLATPMNITAWAANYHRKDFDFSVVIHVIRKPIDCINSVAFTEVDSEKYRATYVNIFGNSFERAVLSLSGWNKLIQMQLPTHTIPLEHASSILGFKDVERYNQRPHPSLNEKQIEKMLRPEIYSIYLDMNFAYQELLDTATPISISG